MEFLPPREHARRFEAARKARVAELRVLGISAKQAKAQATKEFGIYDLMETDDRGWIRMNGLDLPPIARAKKRRHRRVRSLRKP